MSVAFQNSGLRQPQQLKRWLSLKFLVSVLVLTAIVVVATRFGSKAAIKQGLEWIAQLGPLAPVAFIGTYIVGTLLFVPGAILTISAGVLFGLAYGIAYVSVGATLGATGAFLIGRYVARDWLARKLQGNQKFEAIDQAVTREGWKIVGLARLSPVFPFNLLNYAFGLTNIPLKNYFLASWVGMLPGIAMYVYIGTLAGDLARAESRSARSGSAHWVLEILGLIATAVVVVYVTYIARKALKEKGPS